MQYREERKPTRQIAEELGVGFVVEGSARLAGNQVRLTVQLIDARVDEHLWSEEYDLDLSAENLFEVENDIAQQIAAEIGFSLSPNERDQVARVFTENTGAYLQFLRGNEAFLNERQRGLVNPSFRSIRHYQESIELDPDFALARARLALSLTYTSLGIERMERVREEAEAALESLPGLPEARMALGRYFIATGNTADAVSNLEVAVEENPNMGSALLELGQLQRMLGEFDLGLRTLERAKEIDPLNPAVLRHITESLIFDHRYEDALTTNALWQGVYPSNASRSFEAWIRLLRGELEGTRTVMSAVLASGGNTYGYIPGYPRTVLMRALTREERLLDLEDYLGERSYRCQYLVEDCIRKAIHEEEVGSKNQARIYWDSLAAVAERNPPNRHTAYVAVALIYKGQGDKEAAIETAEALVSLDGAFRPGGVEDEFYYGPSAEILLARILAHFDEHDRAIDILEEKLPAPSWLSVPVLEIDPIWDPLRDHPRFQALLEEHRDDVEH
jgi:tetratricopeptide (TPR) repeat protein